MCNYGTCACDVDALKDFEKQDYVQQPCSSASASSVPVDERPHASQSAVGITVSSIKLLRLLLNNKKRRISGQTVNDRAVNADVY